MRHWFLIFLLHFGLLVSCEKHSQNICIDQNAVDLYIDAECHPFDREAILDGVEDLNGYGCRGNLVKIVGEVYVEHYDIHTNVDDPTVVCHYDPTATDSGDLRGAAFIDTIELYLWDINGLWPQYWIESLVLHELTHFIGVRRDHVQEPGSVMSPSVSGVREFTDADWDLICVQLNCIVD